MEIIIIGPKFLLTCFQNFSLSIDRHTVSPNPLVRNLSIIMDPTLSFKTAFFRLRNIAHLCPILSSAAEILIRAFITSRLDYCNSILYCLPSSGLRKLQYVQNSVARLLTHSPSREHVTPILQKLSCLPIKQRILYQILTYKALNNLAPSYRTDLLHRHSSTCLSRKHSKPNFSAKAYP